VSKTGHRVVRKISPTRKKAKGGGGRFIKKSNEKAQERFKEKMEGDARLGEGGGGVFL